MISSERGLLVLKSRLLGRAVCFWGMCDCHKAVKIFTALCEEKDGFPKFWDCYKIKIF